MATAARIATTGATDTDPGIAPKTIARNDDGTKTSRSSFGTGPSDTITQESEFHTEASGRFDARGDQVQVITLSSFTGTDSFVIVCREADGSVIGTTAAIVRGTNAAASDVQTALRAVLTGTDLTVVAGTVDEGPYTVTFNGSEFYGRRFPKLSITGTGCTGVVTRSVDGSTKRYLGETKYEGTTELVGPTLGTITVTPGTNEIQTLTPGAGVDGGTVVLQFRRGRTSPLAYDASVATIQSAIDAAFDQCAGLVGGTDSPVVTMTGTEVLTLDFGDMNTGDTTKLTYNSVESTSTLTYSASITVGMVQALLDEIGLTSSVVTLVRSSNLVYTITKKSSGDFASTVTCTTVSGFTPKGTGGYTLGGKVTTDFDAATGQAVWTFTFSRGKFAGRPVRGGLRVLDSLGLGTFTDGGTADSATLAVSQAGALGSISTAYTEQATVGDSIISTAVLDATGATYSNTTSALDAATPVVITGLPPGVYTFVARTVADRAVSAPSTKAFTMTSS